MADTTEQRLADMGIALPVPATPAANYVPFVRTGNLLFISGQLPFRDGRMTATGLHGRDVDTETGREAAKWCAVNILAQAKAATGDLERIARIVKLTGFVAATPDFVEPHLVVNGASDLLVAALGERGRHTRSALCAASLPLNAAVEVEAILELV